MDSLRDLQEKWDRASRYYDFATAALEALARRASALADAKVLGDTMRGTVAISGSAYPLLMQRGLKVEKRYTTAEVTLQSVDVALAGTEYLATTRAGNGLPAKEEFRSATAHEIPPAQ